MLLAKDEQSPVLATITQRLRRFSHAAQFPVQEDFTELAMVIMHYADAQALQPEALLNKLMQEYINGEDDLLKQIHQHFIAIIDKNSTDFCHDPNVFIQQFQTQFNAIYLGSKRVHAHEQEFGVLIHNSTFEGDPNDSQAVNAFLLNIITDQSHDLDEFDFEPNPSELPVFPSVSLAKLEESKADAASEHLDASAEAQELFVPDEDELRSQQEAEEKAVEQRRIQEEQAKAQQKAQEEAAQQRRVQEERDRASVRSLKDQIASGRRKLPTTHTRAPLHEPKYNEIPAQLKGLFHK